MDNYLMDIQKVRRKRLAQLIRDRYGSQADYCAQTGENQGETSALLKAKSFGEKKARSIEAKCSLPAGWLDDSTSLSPVTASQGDHVQRVNDLESRLLTLFRSTDDQGRLTILQAAEVVRKV